MDRSATPRVWSRYIIRDFFQGSGGRHVRGCRANSYKSSSRDLLPGNGARLVGTGHEPQTQFAADYAKYRPKTKFFPFFVSDVSDSTAQLYV